MNEGLDKIYKSWYSSITRLTFDQLKLIKIEIIGLLEILRVIKLITNKFKTIHQVRHASAFINVEKIAG